MQVLFWPRTSLDDNNNVIESSVGLKWNTIIHNYRNGSSCWLHLFITFQINGIIIMNNVIQSATCLLLMAIYCFRINHEYKFNQIK